MIDDLSYCAQRLGRYMAKNCTSGMPRCFQGELLAAFPDDGSAAIRRAPSELRRAGLVTLTVQSDCELPSARTTIALFIAADAAITGHDPVVDSIVLARLLIDDPALGHVPALEAATGWNRRRFNPALGLITLLFDKGCRSEIIQLDYPTLGLILGDEEIATLRRHVHAYS